MTPDPSPSGETWVCRAAKGYTRCDVLPCTVRGYPEHKRCGPVPSSDTPSDGQNQRLRAMAVESLIREWLAEDISPCRYGAVEYDAECPWHMGEVDWPELARHIASNLDRTPPPTPVDGDSGRASEQFIEALTEAMQNAWNDFVGDTGCYPDDFEIHGNELHAQFGRSNFVRFVAGWLPTAPPVGEERRPVDGGERSQSEQWFVVHHNQLRSLRFGTFPIERFARASIAACTCGPHTLRHTVTTTYTASTTEEFVAAAADRGEPTQ